MLPVSETIFYHQLLYNLTPIAAPVGMILLSGVVLGFMSRKAFSWLWHALGTPGVALMALIGVPVHELSHAAACLIFGHRIVDLKLFDLSALRGGSAGYVISSYNPLNPWQGIGNFFIGMAPIIGGTAVIRLALFNLLPVPVHLVNSFFYQPVDYDAFLTTIGDFFSYLISPENIASPGWWIFMYIALAVSAHMNPSSADYASTAWGLFTIFLLVAIATAIWGYLPQGAVDCISIFTTRLAFILTVALSFGLANFLFSAVLYWISEQFRRKYQDLDPAM